MTRRALPPLPKVVMPNGRRPCRGCGAEVPKSMRTWCTRECRERHYMALSTYARIKVRARDHGVCEACGSVGGEWEADHRVPLAEGGTNDLSNYRTLCIPCHRAATRELAARMARARRAAGDLFSGPHASTLDRRRRGE